MKLTKKQEALIEYARSSYKIDLGYGYNDCTQQSENFLKGVLMMAGWDGIAIMREIAYLQEEAKKEKPIV